MSKTQIVTQHRLILSVLIVAVLLGCSGRATSVDTPKNRLPDAARVGAATKQQSVSSLIEICRRERSDTLVIPTVVDAPNLESIAELVHLECLELYKSEFDPKRVECLAGLSKLERLRLEDLAADDATMDALAGLSGLRVLNLPAANISNDGLQRIVDSFPKMELLRFGSPLLTDAGVATLSNAPSLRFLHLINVHVTDEGLRTFHSMHQLESLYIDGGDETESGIRDLLKANPRLHFHRNQIHIAEDPNADPH